MAFAHGAQHQPRAGEFQHGPCGRDKRETEVQDDVMGEDDGPDHRNIRQRAEVDIAQARRFHPDIALPQERREPEPEERKCQAGSDLVGQCNLGKEGKKQRQQCPACSGGGKAQQG